MRNQRGYYDVLVRSCAVNHGRIAVRQVEDDNSVRTLTYSEIFGVCEYVSQNLQLLKCGTGIIAIVTQRNILVPAVIAAVHKNSPTFMFVEPEKDNETILKSIKFQAIIVLYHKDKPFTFLKSKPEKEICVYDIIIQFYKIQSVLENHSFIERNSKFTDERSFIVSTSGSTGTPKHVQVPVQCIHPNITDLNKMFNMTSSDVVHFSTPLTFDPSMVEILLACTSGASLLLAPPNCESIYEPGEHSITVWQTTPSVFFNISGKSINSVLSSYSKLRILAFGGEPFVYVKQLKQFKDKWNDTKIFCLYGVTEMSCWACAAELHLDTIEDDREIPLGQCLSETDLRIIVKDKEDKIGAIKIGSSSRQCNVLNKPVLHQSKGKRWIDTGDLAEMKNGSIYYRGRSDNIIKRFGHKVYLQTIERTVMTCLDIKCCTCLWLPSPRVLILFYASDTVTTQQLQSFCAANLDDKSTPDKIVRVDSVPLNKHGKVNKDKLLAETPVHINSGDDLKSSFLKELKILLKRYFLYDEIKDKDFFSIGGTSFLAVALCNKLAAQFPHQDLSILPSLLTPKVTIDEIARSLPATGNRSLSSSKIRKRKTQKSSLSNYPPRKLSHIFSDILNRTIRIEKHWSQDTGKCVDAMPTVMRTATRTYVTVGSHSGRVMVVNAMNGHLYGSLDLKARIEAPVLCLTSFGNPCGVIGAYDGTVLCFSLEPWSVCWKSNIKSMIKSKAAMANQMVYMASYDGKVRCLNPLNGEITNTINLSKNSISADLVSVQDKSIVVCTLGGICALINSVSNAVIWKVPVESPIFAAPVVINDDRVVFAEVNKIVHCLTLVRGETLWRFEGAKGNIFSSISVKMTDLTAEMVFGCHDSYLYCISVEDTTVLLKWKCKTKSEIFSTPCYLSDNLILAASIKGRLHVVDSETGTILHEYVLPGETFSSPCVVQKQILIGCRDNYVHSLKCSLVSNL